MKELILLGSTGSIGQSTLNVIKKNKEIFKIKLLSTNKNIKKLYKQALMHNVNNVVIYDNQCFKKNSHLFIKKKNQSF